ncbi:multidrug resistance protein B, partial [Mycobacterium marinum]
SASPGLRGLRHFQDRRGQRVVSALALLDVATYSFITEKRGPRLFHVLAHLFDVEQDQLILPAPAERNL